MRRPFPWGRNVPLLCSSLKTRHWHNIVLLSQSGITRVTLHADLFSKEAMCFQGTWRPPEHYLAKQKEKTICWFLMGEVKIWIKTHDQELTMSSWNDGRKWYKSLHWLGSRNAVGTLTDWRHSLDPLQKYVHNNPTRFIFLVVMLPMTERASVIDGQKVVHQQTSTPSGWPCKLNYWRLILLMDKRIVS